MRKPSKDMVLTDERILEYLRDVEDPATSKKMRESGKLLAAQSTVSRRLNKLANLGLLVRYGNGVYTISEEGEGYLAGAYDVGSGEWIE